MGRSRKPTDRRATRTEAERFTARLDAIAERARARARGLAAGTYEVRVVAVRPTLVLAHNRAGHDRAYLARVKKGN